MTNNEPSTLQVDAWVEELFRAHIDSVFNVAYRVLWSRADAEDVVQASFLKAFGRLHQLEDPSRVRPWLLQIAYREAITVLRRRRDVPTDPASIPEQASTHPAPDDIAISNEIAGLISSALSKLDPNERMAVVLRDIERLPMSEVADVLEIGLSAAKMRVHRGRQSLRVLLENQDVL